MSLWSTLQKQAQIRKAEPVTISQAVWRYEIGTVWLPVQGQRAWNAGGLLRLSAILRNLETCSVIRLP